MLATIAKGVEEKNDFDVVQVKRGHVYKASVHGDNFISTVTKGEVWVVAEVEGLFQEDQLGLEFKFFMILAKLIEDKVQCGEVRDGVIVCLRNTFKDEASEGAIVCLPDFVSFCMCDSIGLG